MSDVFNFSVETSAATSDGEQSTVEHSMSPTNSDVVARIRQTRKTRRRIPNEKWEEKRPLITRLYQVERRSLNEVMQILKRDDWDPTYVKHLNPIPPPFSGFFFCYLIIRISIFAFPFLFRLQD